MSWVLLLLYIKLCAGQLSLNGGGDVELISGSAGAMMMPQISSLDVQCEKSGMTVEVSFTLPFNGVIFSKGHFSNPACRFVAADSGKSSFTFEIPSGECGSVMEQLDNGIPGSSGGSRTMLTNTIIMQGDDTVQEIWDIARTIKCDWVDNFIKTVAFNPFTVGMLNSQEVRFGGETIDCWMDLKLGRWPNINDINSVVKIGETLSLLVYARDNKNMYDVSIQDCYAYSGPNFDDFNTPRIQLTDTQGCILKEKLISPFYTARERDSEGEVIVTYAFVQAFKFPDAMNVFMTCNVEVCKGDCDNRCGAISTTEAPFRFGSTLFGEPVTTLAPTTPDPCPPGSINPKCLSKFPTIPCSPGSQDPKCNINIGKSLSPATIPNQQTIPSPTTFKPRCFSGSIDPRCPKPTTPAPPICFPGSKDLRCPKPKTTPPPRCFPGSRDPRCPKTTTPAPPKCFRGSRDPRCPKPTTPAPPKCFRGSRDPRCPKPTTPAPPKCFRGSKDPRCPKPTTPAPLKCFPGSKNPRCPQPTTPAPPKCFPGSKDPRCPPTCFPGSIDPRCPKPTTPAPPRCFAGSKDLRCPRPTTTTPAPPRCFTGSKDPRCPKPPTTRTPVCFAGSLDPKCPPTCFPGSIDPRCPKPTTPAPPRCFAGSKDPRCPRPTTTSPAPPRCFRGSTDPRCPKPTTTPAPPRCFTGSKDPRCPKPPTTRTPVCFAGSLNPKCPPTCFPGSIDRRCPKPSTTPAPPICFFGSTDPRCPKPSTTPIPPQCFVGSIDPRCPRLTPIPNRNCIAGSNLPECQMNMQDPVPQPTTPAPPKCFPGSPDPRCPIITSIAPFRCFLGSPDPRCRPSTTTPAAPICIPGSNDPRCPQTTLPIRFGSTLFPATITTLRPTTPKITTPRPTRPQPTTQRPQTRRPTTRRPFTVPITTLRPRPTTTPPRGGFAVKSPFVTTPPSPKLKPTTTKSPNRGKQIGGVPQPKPEPTGKEWEGEARYHAFHSYHYQRGDGRRNRNFGTRSRRDVEDEYPHSRFPRSSLTNPRVLQQKVPVRLSRSLHVVAPSDLPLPRSFMPAAQTAKPIFADPFGTVCFEMIYFAPAILAILLLLILSSTAVLILYMRNSNNSKLDTSYVDANSGKSQYTFVIPMAGCGTRSFNTPDGESTGFENMIMMQNEEMVQEIWDIARKLTCDWTTRMEKLITFRPFAVDMLQAEEVRYSGDDVMCWMDIQLGKGPFASPVDGIVKIGDEMTIVVYSKDGGADYDMLIKNCYAYDSQDLESSTKLQLSDEQGCLLKPKLMNYFVRTRNTGNTGADLIAYATMYAFKFPDKMDVFLSCEVELCKGGCDNFCDGVPSKIVERFETTTKKIVTIPPPPPDICVTNPSLPQCCAKNPNNPACTTTSTTTTTTTTTTRRPRPNPCLLNPGTLVCCSKNPNNPACTTTTSTTTTRAPDQCLLRPGSQLCCRRRPSHSSCTTSTTPTPDPCVLRPGSQLCCGRRPSHSSCVTTTPNPCLLNPGTPQCCARNPTNAACTTTSTTTTTTTTQAPDPCILRPGSLLCCNRRPNHSSCITTTTSTTTTTARTPRPNPCFVNPGSRQCCLRTPNNPSCTTTTTSTTTAPPDPCDLNSLLPQCCRQNPNLPQCTTTTPRTTTSIFDPCIRNPGAIICCARNPSHPACTTTTVTTTPTTTTTRKPTDPCIRNPGSSQCCFRKPDHPSCPTDKPCEGNDDPRPQCKPTTPAAPTTRDLSNHAFHRGQKPTGRRRRPTYGSRLTPEKLNELTNNPRRRRDVSYVAPPPPPPPRTIAMTKNFRVVGANDLTFRAASSEVPTYQSINSICVPTSTFYVGLLLLTLMLVVAVLVATFTCLRLRSTQLSTKPVEAKNPYYKQ